MRRALLAGGLAAAAGAGFLVTRRWLERSIGRAMRGW